MASRRSGAGPSLGESSEAQASSLQTLWSDVRKRHHALGKILDRLRGIAPADIDGEWADLENHLAHFRLACVKIPFHSWEFAAENKIDNLLWEAHTTVVNLFRAVLRKLPSEMRVRKRNVEKCYREFISTARLFYKTYIQNLSKTYPIERLHRVANAVHVLRGSGDGNISREQESQILRSVQQTLTCLGDLSRYQNQLRPNERDVQSAIDYYSLAHDMQPDNGYALHQIGVTHLETDQHLDAAYYFYLSLARATPHAMAPKNLEQLFRDMRRGPPSSGIQNRIQILGGRAVQLHARYTTNETFPPRKELEQTVLQQLKEILQRTDLDKLHWDKLPVKLAVVNMGSFYAVKDREDLGLARTYTFAFNLLFLESICKILCDHIEQAQGLMPGEASGKENYVAPGMAAAISALRLYCCWISSYAQQLAQPALVAPAAPELAYMVRNMWIAFAKVAEMIVDYFRDSVVELSARTGQDLLVTAPYLLEEDEAAASYLALGDTTSEVYCRLFCRQGDDGRSGDQKPSALELDSDELTSLDELICRVGDIMWSIQHFSVNEIYPVGSSTDESRTFHMEYGYGFGSPHQPQGAPLVSQQQAGDNLSHIVNGGVDGAGAYYQGIERSDDDDGLDDAQLQNIQQIYRVLEGPDVPEAASTGMKLKGKSRMEEPAVALKSYCEPLPGEWYHQPWTLSIGWKSLSQVAFLEIPNALLPPTRLPPFQSVQRPQPSRPSRQSQPQSSRSHHMAASTDGELDQQRQALLRMLKDSDLISKPKDQAEPSATKASSGSAEPAASSQPAPAQPSNPPQRTLYRPGQVIRGGGQNHAGHGPNSGRPQSSYGAHSGRGGSGRGHNRHSSHGQSGQPSQQGSNQGSNQGSQQRHGHRHRNSREGNSFRGGRGGGNRSEPVVLAHRSRPSG